MKPITIHLPNEHAKNMCVCVFSQARVRLVSTPYWEPR